MCTWLPSQHDCRIADWLLARITAQKGEVVGRWKEPGCGMSREHVELEIVKLVCDIFRKCRMGCVVDVFYLMVIVEVVGEWMVWSSEKS